MEKEFIPYEQALALKELGFNEPCFATYFGLGAWQIDCTEGALNLKNNKSSKYSILAPTYQQAFRWFREKYNLDSYLKPEIINQVKTYDYYIWIGNNEDLEIGVSSLSTYEEAELECLKKLIEIVKNK